VIFPVEKYRSTELLAVWQWEGNVGRERLLFALSESDSCTRFLPGGTLSVLLLGKGRDKG
jgi:hypothetical protein